jgi:hypothetical protein
MHTTEDLHTMFSFISMCTDYLYLYRQGFSITVLVEKRNLSTATNTKHEITSIFFFEPCKSLACLILEEGKPWKLHSLQKGDQYDFFIFLKSL